MSVDPPGSLLVETGNYCNLRCPACATGRGELGLSRGFMTGARARAIAANCMPYIKRVGLFNWGELFVNPDYLEIIRVFAETGAFTSVDTNLVARRFSAEEADAIAGSGLGQILASIDGATQEGYQAYRVRGRLDRALRNIEMLLEARERRNGDGPEVVWKFLVNDANEHEMTAAAERALEIGVPIIYELNNKSRWSRRRNRREAGIPIVKARYDADFSLRRSRAYPIPVDEIELHDVLHDAFCRHPFLGVVIHWDGRVLPCCGVFDDSDCLGDLSSQSLEEVWNGAPMKAVRRYLLGFGPRQTGRSACETMRCPVPAKQLPPLTAAAPAPPAAAQRTG